MFDDWVAGLGVDDGSGRVSLEGWCPTFEVKGVDLVGLGYQKVVSAK